MASSSQKNIFKKPFYVLKKEGLCFNCDRITGNNRCICCHYRFFCGKMCQEKAQWFHLTECYQIDLTLVQNLENQLLIEAVNNGFFCEYKKKKSRVESKTADVLTQAQYMVYSAVLEWILLNPVDGNLPNLKEKTDYSYQSRVERYHKALVLCKEAGQFLVENKKGHFMNDYREDEFIPKKIRQDLEVFWDGIGTWRSQLKK